MYGKVWALAHTMDDLKLDMTDRRFYAAYATRTPEAQEALDGAQRKLVHAAIRMALPTVLIVAPINLLLHRDVVGLPMGEYQKAPGQGRGATRRLETEVAARWVREATLSAA